MTLGSLMQVQGGGGAIGVCVVHFVVTRGVPVACALLCRPSAELPTTGAAVPSRQPRGLAAVVHPLPPG